MKTILVDDDPLGLQGFKIECGDIEEIEIIGEFNDSFEAVNFALQNHIEFALLDIDMPGMSGIELADKIREINPGVVIVFVTAHTAKAAEAMQKKADYIIFKPYDKTDVLDVVERAQLLSKRQRKRVYCKTFGHFDVFIDDKPVHFRLAKAKELLALCITRMGAPVSTEEIIDKLWPEYIGRIGECSTFRTTAKELKDLFISYGLKDVFGRERNMCYINADMISCDYYDFLKGDMNAYCHYQHEFMFDYDWGEYFIATLDEMKQKKNEDVFSKKA